MSEILHQVNFDPDGHALTGNHHDAALQTTIEAGVAERSVGETAFQSIIDSESLNGTYAREISDINAYFAAREMPISPVVVVTQDTMNRAYAAAAERPTEDVESAVGRSVHGRAVIIEDQEFGEIFGTTYIVATGIHEAAHSEGEHHLVVTSRRTDFIGKEGQNIPRTTPGEIAISGLTKIDLRRDTSNKLTGDFWEEAYADLTRLKGMRYLGYGHDIKGDSKVLGPTDGVNVTVVSKNFAGEQANFDPAVTVIPAEFAADAITTLEGNDTVAFSAPNLAAYALELLDSRVPGLYNDMVAGRRDPRRQAEAIRKIESVQPGLYRQLRDLEYNTPDFAQGLHAVVQAISPVPSTK